MIRVGVTRLGQALGLTTAQILGVLLAVLLLSLGVQIALMGMPLYMLHLMEGVTESRSTSTLSSLTLLVIIAIGIAAVLRLLRQALLQTALMVVERKLYLASLKSSIRLAREGKPEAASLTLTDFGMLKRFLSSSVVSDVTDLLAFPIPLAFMFAMHPLLGWTTLVGSALVASFSVLTERLGRSRAKTSSALSARAASELSRRLMRRDELLGLGLLPGIVRHWFPLKRKALLQQEDLHARIEILSSIGHALALLTICAVFVVSAYLVIHNEASGASFSASHVIAYSLVMPFERVAQHWVSWSQAFASFARLSETLQLAAGTGARRFAYDPEQFSTGLYVSALRLEIPGGKRVLVDDLHLHAPPGTVIAVTGRNGTGKSSLLRALLGLIQPASGAIVFESKVMHEVSRTEIGPRLGFLGQRPQLLEGSILDNICRFSGDADGAFRAARLAGAHEMIGRLPGGYSAPAGQRAGLSGGQQRQVALARAFYGSPGLVLLDEPEVGLDAKTISALVAAVTELRSQGAIVFLVTHDPAHWAGVADLELRLEGAGAWSTQLLKQQLATA